MKTRSALVWMVGLLFLTGLACSQAGEILTPAEATARAEAVSQPAASDTEETTGSNVDAEFSEGDAVILVSGGAVVPLRNKITDQSALNFAPVNQPATILAVQQASDGQIWYQIDSTSGKGWVTADRVQAADSGDEVEASDGPQVGDTVYLTGRGFLINLMTEAGGNRIQANQERGVEVTILQVAVVDGDPWYQIDAPTGEGWVTAENITTEVP